METELVTLFVRLAESHLRVDAAAQLARCLGLDSLLVFLRDPSSVRCCRRSRVSTAAQGRAMCWRTSVASARRREGITAGGSPFGGESGAATAYSGEAAARSFLLRCGAERAVMAIVLGRFALASAGPSRRAAVRGATRSRGRRGPPRNVLALALDTPGRARASARRRSGPRARERRAGTLRRRTAAKDEFLAMLGSRATEPPRADLRRDRSCTRVRRCVREPVEREHEIIERQTQQLVRLVDDLLDVSRITRGEIELRRAPVELPRSSRARSRCRAR